MLESDWVATAMRLMRRLELLPSVMQRQAALTSEGWDQTLRVVDRLAEMLGAVAEPDQVGNLPLAELSLKLGRYRAKLEGHLNATIPGGHRSSQILFLAALHTEVKDAKESAYASARELRYSEAEAGLARSLAGCRLRAADLEGDITDLGAHRYFRDCETSGIEATLLYLAISLSESPTQDRWEMQVDVARKLFEAWFKQHDQIVAPPQLVRGDKLAAALNLPQGPIIGELLAALAEEQVQARIATESEALEFARDWMFKRG